MGEVSREINPGSMNVNITEIHKREELKMNLMKVNETIFTCYFIVVTIVVELYVAFHGCFGPKMAILCPKFPLLGTKWVIKC